MTDAHGPGVVVDTMVFSWLLDDRPDPLAERDRELIGSQPVLLAFQTVMELAFRRPASWVGRARRRRLERRIAEIAVVQPDHDMITACAELRLRCQQAGHALGNKVHGGDRWIAATAIRLGVPLVSHDRLFTEAPGLRVVTAEASQ